MSYYTKMDDDLEAKQPEPLTPLNNTNEPVMPPFP